MRSMQQLLDGLAYLFYPNTCLNCSSALPNSADYFCINCLYNWPRTYFELHSENALEKNFRGRARINEVTAYCFFKKGTSIQSLVHLLKYKNERQAASFIGGMMAGALKTAPLYQHIELLVPVPMFGKKEKRRGYNQAILIAEAIQHHWTGPVIKEVLKKLTASDSQTDKSRWQRKINMEARFELIDAPAIHGKHILLIDDIITTGATLESCALALEKGNPASINIACFAWSAEQI